MKKIKITINRQAIVKNLPKWALETVIKDLTFRNPAYVSAMRYGKYISPNTPSKLYYFEIIKNSIVVPKGYVQEIQSLCTSKGYNVTIKHNTATIPKQLLPIKFTGTLRPYQQEAFNAALECTKGVIEAPTIITNDPMHTLWFPKWFLRFVSPILPVFVVELIRSIVKRIQLRGMKEGVQKRRAETFADNAEIWKWKRAADAVKNFELFDKVSSIIKEVIVTNGTEDKIHNQADYPKIAAELPNGRFIYMKTDESRRERLMGLVALEFSKITKIDDIPHSLRDFEKKLHR